MEYSGPVQTVFAIYVIAALGYALSRFNVFTLDEVRPIWKMLSISAIPITVFIQIANRPPSIDTWYPYFVSLALSIFSFLVLKLTSTFFEHEGKTLRYLSYSYSISLSEFLVFSYPIVSQAFGADYVYIPVLMSAALYLFTVPVNEYFAYPLRVKQNCEDVPINPIENEEIEFEAGEISQEVASIAPDGTPAVDIESQSAEEDASNSLSIDMVEKTEFRQEDAEYSTRSKSVLLSIVSPVNVFVLLGLGWSFTKIQLPSIITDFAADMEMCIAGSGLFTIGVYMGKIPFSLIQCLYTLPSVVSRLVIFPLLTIGLCYAFNLSSLVSQIILLCSSAPMGLLGITAAKRYSEGMEYSIYSFFWTMIFSLPCTIVWIVLCIEFKIFN